MLPSDPFYQAAVTIAKGLAKQNLAVITGGGPGAMEATHLGALLQNEPDGALREALQKLKGRKTLPADAGTAWRHGLRLGLHCSTCCAGLTTILLVIGVMDLRAMAVVAAAITVERLAPAGERVARAIGAFVVATGLFLLARAAGLR